jgi:hypothetical protein
MQKDESMRRPKGQAVLEVALLSPWIFFLFVGALDMGFYTHDLIVTQDAARVAVEYTSSQEGSSKDSAGACQYALAEMGTLTNLRSVSSCSALPLIVVANSVIGVDGAAASSVSVTYQTVRLIPIPFLLPQQLTVTRTVQMRVRNL